MDKETDLLVKAIDRFGEEKDLLIEGKDLFDKAIDLFDQALDLLTEEKDLFVEAIFLFVEAIDRLRIPVPAAAHRLGRGPLTFRQTTERKIDERKTSFRDPPDAARGGGAGPG